MMKKWQHGYELDYLLELEGHYSYYNKFSCSPFSSVKKNTIAAGLHEDAMFGFLIPWYIYTTVGIWRSSDRYKGPKFWSILAKIAVILGVLSAIGQLISGTY